jgi:hypothetical protein
MIPNSGCGIFGRPSTLEKDGGKMKEKTKSRGAIFFSF